MNYLPIIAVIIITILYISVLKKYWNKSIKESFIDPDNELVLEDVLTRLQDKTEYIYMDRIEKKTVYNPGFMPQNIKNLAISLVKPFIQIINKNTKDNYTVNGFNKIVEEIDKQNNRKYTNTSSNKTLKSKTCTRY